MQAVVLVGGEGMRLRPLTSVTPKPMIPVMNMPFLERTLRRLKAAGIEKRQVERVRQVRASRDQAACDARLHELESAARGADNLMPKIVAACEAMATVGEISDRLRRVFGEYRDS